MIKNKTVKEVYVLTPTPLWGNPAGWPHRVVRSQPEGGVKKQFSVFMVLLALFGHYN